MSDLSDPYWGNVISVLNMLGSNGSNIFQDSKSNIVWTNNNNLTISNSLGYNVASFLGSEYLTRAYTSDFNWWVTAFTIEAWIRADSFSSWGTYSNMIGNMNPDNSIRYWSFGPTPSNKLRFMVS